MSGRVERCLVRKIRNTTNAASDIQQTVARESHGRGILETILLRLLWSLIERNRAIVDSGSAIYFRGERCPICFDKYHLLTGVDPSLPG